MDGQLELLPQPEPVDITEIAARIGAIADARPHGPAPTDTDVRRESMADLRDGEDLAAEQGARPSVGFVPIRSGPGSQAFAKTRAALQRSTDRPRV